MVVTIRISKQRRIFSPNCICNACHSHSLLRDFDYNCCKKYAVYCLYNIIPSIYTVGRPIFWSLSQKIKQLRGRSVGCVN